MSASHGGHGEPKWKWDIRRRSQRFPNRLKDLPIRPIGFGHFTKRNDQTNRVTGSTGSRKVVRHLLNTFSPDTKNRFAILIRRSTYSLSVNSTRLNCRSSRKRRNSWSVFLASLSDYYSREHWERSQVMPAELATKWNRF